MENSATATVNETVVDPAFIKAVQSAARMFLEASAQITLEARKIDRTCPHSDDPVLVYAVRNLKTISDDLAEYWHDINSTLADYELLEPR